MVIVSQVKNRGVLQVLSEEVSLKEAPECGQGLGGPDICEKRVSGCESPVCEPCGDGEYMPEYNPKTSCIVKTYCDPTTEQKDTECEACPKNYYSNITSAKEPCIPWTS
ncbi:UNVERIFIED_CONTAM: hypothetical protein FKN15_077747 [Acipenser sinensis]